MSITLKDYFGDGAGAIGNYVHYYARNYKEHGTTTKGKNTYQSNKEAIRTKAMAELKKQNISQKTIKEMEAFLNYIYKSDAAKSALTKPSDTFYTKEFQEREEELLKLITDKIVSEYPKIRVDADTRNVIGNKPDPTTSSLKKIRVKKEQHNVQVQNIVNKIQTIEKYREQLAAGIVSNDNIQLSDLNKKILAIKNNLIDVLKSANNLDLGRKGKYKISSFDKSMFSGTLSLDAAASNLVDDINKLITKIKGPPINKLKGDLEELIVGSLNIAEILKSNADIAIKEELFKVVGNDRSRRNIDLSNFAESEYLLNKLSKDYIIDDEMSLTIRSRGSSQDKVDVVLRMDEKDINASVKNFKLNSSNAGTIDINSSASFMAMIQDENDDQFVNHYLNLMARHTYKTKFKKAEGLLTGDDSRIDYSQKNAARVEMGLRMLYKSLVGYNNAGGKAGVFIVNNNRTGEVTIVNMTKVLDVIISNNMKKEQKLLEGCKILYNKNKDFVFQNKFADTPRTRIHNLLNEIHATKVTAMIKFKRDDFYKSVDK